MFFKCMKSIKKKKYTPHSKGGTTCMSGEPWPPQKF